MGQLGSFYKIHSIVCSEPGFPEGIDRTAGPFCGIENEKYLKRWNGGC